MSQDNYEGAVALVSAFKTLLSTNFVLSRKDGQKMSSLQHAAIQELLTIGNEIIADFEKEEDDGETLASQSSDDAYNEVEGHETPADSTESLSVSESIKANNPDVAYLEDEFQEYLKQNDEGIPFCEEGTCEACDATIADLSVQFAAKKFVDMLAGLKG